MLPKFVTYFLIFPGNGIQNLQSLQNTKCKIRQSVISRKFCNIITKAQGVFYDETVNLTNKTFFPKNNIK